MECAAVEVCKAHATRALDVLQLHQLSLERAALGVLPPAKALAHFLHDGRESLESETLGPGRDIPLHLAQEGLRLGPAGVDLVDGAAPRQQALGRHRGDVVPDDVDRHIGVHDFVRHRLGQGAVEGALQRTVGCLEPAHCLAVDEVLEGCGQDGELMEVQAAVAQAILEEAQNLPGHAIFQGLHRGRARPGLAGGLQATDLPAVQLHEEAVQRVARGRGAQAAAGALGQGHESRAQGLFEAAEARLRRTAMLTPEHVLKLGQDGAPLLQALVRSPRFRRHLPQEGARANPPRKQQDTEGPGTQQGGSPHRSGHSLAAIRNDSLKGGTP
mmetsp:Transcript_47669/g.147537  ORF Transcript_47669/g.147537 Transcript_47669/m.147537 type:complete len:328 (+) Transcript_47669:942-1925(+)